MAMMWFMLWAVAFLSLVALQTSQSNEGRSKCLLVSIDNRALNTNLGTNDYVSMNAVVTRAYAKYHNYDYLYIENGAEGLYDKVISKYTDVANQKEASDARSICCSVFFCL